MRQLITLLIALGVSAGCYSYSPVTRALQGDTYNSVLSPTDTIRARRALQDSLTRDVTATDYYTTALRLALTYTPGNPGEALSRLRATSPAALTPRLLPLRDYATASTALQLRQYTLADSALVSLTGDTRNPLYTPALHLDALTSHNLGQPQKALTRARQYAKATAGTGRDDYNAAQTNLIAGESLATLDSLSSAVPYFKRYLEYTRREHLSPDTTALLALAIDAFNTGDYVSAADYLRAPSLSTRPLTSATANLLAAHTLLAKGDTAAAIPHLTTVIDLDADKDLTQNALFNITTIKTLQASAPRAAIIALQTYLERYPTSPRSTTLRQNLAALQLRTNNPGAALTTLDAIRATDDATKDLRAAALLRLGLTAIDQSRPQDAVDTLQTALQTAPRTSSLTAPIHLAIGRAALLSDDATTALNHLTTYCNSGDFNNQTPGDRATALYNLAYAQLQLQKFPAAGQTLNKLLGTAALSQTLTTAHRADALTRLGDAQYAQSAFAQASASYAKAADMYTPAAAYPLIQLATIQNAEGKSGDAEATLKKLLSAHSDSPLRPQAMLLLAQTQTSLDDKDAAIATLSDIASQYPQTTYAPQALDALAMLQSLQGDTQGQTETLQALINKYPHTPQAQDALSTLQDLTRGGSITTETLTEIIDQAPDDISITPTELDDTRYAAALGQYLDNDNPAALRAYLAQNPDTPHTLEAMQYLLQYAVSEHDYDTATALGTRIINQYPDTPESDDALQELADIYADTDQPTLLLQTLQALSERASSPQELRDIRLRILQTTPPLGLNRQTIATADKLLADPSLLTPEQHNKTLLLKTAAQAAEGDSTTYVANLTTLSAYPQDASGAQALALLSQYYLDHGQAKKASDTALRLVDAASPHHYWVARAIITLADSCTALGDKDQARRYIISLQRHYPGKDPDILQAINSRL